MKKSVSWMVWFALLGGCTHDPGPDLKSLASGLENPWPGPHRPSMTITVREPEGRLVLHCRLQNDSLKALALDQSQLPWKQSIYFTGTIVTFSGRTYPIGPVAVLAYIVASPHPVSLAPNEVLEGDFELRYLPKNPMVGPRPPQDEDTLLAWSYDLRTYPQMPLPDSSPHDLQPTQSVRFVGITFLPKEAMRELAP